MLPHPIEHLVLDLSSLNALWHRIPSDIVHRSVQQFKPIGMIEDCIFEFLYML